MKKAIYFVCLSILMFVVVSCKNSSDKKLEDPNIVEAKIDSILFGLNVDNYEVSKNIIKSGESFSVLLTNSGMNSADVNQCVEMCEGVFDLRNIRAGRPYYVFMDKNKENLQCFVYEHSNLEHLIIDFRDSLMVRLEEKEIEQVTRISSGEIESSLWNAVTAIGVNFELALKLSEIYAWTVDFYALQKGDKFTVLYDEIQIDGKTERIGDIKYAYFEHNGKPLYAFAYQQDSIVEFFNKKGENLRGAFLKAPLRFTRISSKFSNSRLHPVLRIRRPHHGVDYAAPIGTPVMSIGDGEVIHCGYSGGAGHLVKIRHNGVYSTAYMHLSKYGSGIKKGSRVRQGQVIGYVGSTGLSTGPHLDFRFYKNGTPIDPLTVESPPVDPIREENKEDFLKTIEFPIIVLDSMKGKNRIMPLEKHGVEFQW